MDFRMDSRRRRYIGELEEASTTSLSARGHEHLRNALKDYYKSRDVERFVHRLTSLLNTPQKLDLLKKVRAVRHMCGKGLTR